MSTPTSYTFSLDDAEIARFRAMAAAAQENESALWELAGIRAGRHVVDLGCGPGALLSLLAQRVGSAGTVIGVDIDPDTCATARSLTSEYPTVRVVHADAAHTGLPPRSADVVMCRNVLVHNGPRTAHLLAHAASLLRSGGRLVSAEPDVGGIDFGDAHEEKEYDQRWAAMMRADGHDPDLGRGDRLVSLLRVNGWTVLAQLSWKSALLIEKSPAWGAAELLVHRGFASRNEIASWRRALAARQARGPLSCVLTTTTVVALT